MKKFLGLMLMPVLACGMALAQSNMSSSTTQTSDHNDQMTNGKAKTMEGCVQERDGNYFLTTKKHKQGIELMGSDDVKNDVGHKVSVTGTMAMNDNAMNEHHSSTSAEDPMGTTHDSGHDADYSGKHHKHVKGDMMNVTSVQSLGATCDMK